MKIISRSEWNARPSKSPVPTTDIDNRTGFVVHHSGTDAKQTVREIQGYHMSSDQLAKGGWKDIGYNYLITKDGKIFEGLGLNKIGAHVAGHNTKNIGVCLLGNFEKSTPTDAMMESLKWLYAYVNGKKGDTLKLYGHRNLGSTACPGDKLYARLDSIKGGTPPKPQPSKPESNWTEKLVKKLPTVNEGDSGFNARLVQGCLHANGYRSSAIDGEFGKNTKKDVTNFQRSKDLTPDGIVGPKTWPKLLGR